MKKILVLFTILALMSCSKENDIKSKSESFLKEHLKDPNSYENISISITDTTKESDLLNEKISEMIINSDNYIFGSAKPFHKKIDSIKNVISNYKKNPNSDPIGYITINIKYRAKNSFGAFNIGETVFHYYPRKQTDNEQIVVYSNK